MNINLVIAVLVLLSILCFYFCVYRNFEVYHFKMTLNRLVHTILVDYLDSDVWNTNPTEAERKYLKMDAVGDSICFISYNRLLFSFKSLTIENWLTAEQIDFLLHGNVVVDNDESNQTDMQDE